MVVKLYGSSMSTCTRRVAVVLHEKQVPFEFCSIDLMKGEHKTLQYLKKQPFGQVPYFVCRDNPETHEIDDRSNYS